MPDISFQLVQAGLGDAGTIDPMVKSFHIEEGAIVSDRVRRNTVETLLANPAFGRIFLVELADGARAGYAALAFGFSLEFGGRDAFLDELYILPAYRGRGLGGATLAAVNNWVEAEGICALHLEVEKANKTAKQLYLKSGFADREHYHLMTRQIADVRSS